MRKTIASGLWITCLAVIAAATLSGCGVSSCGGHAGYGEQVTGRLIRGSDCRYRFEGEQGAIVTITMRRIDQTLDPRLELQDPDDVIVAENDDHRDSRDSQIRSYALKLDGTYTIVAAAYNDDSGGQFELALERDLKLLGPADKDGS